MLGLGEILIAWLLVLASAAGGLEATANALGEGYTAACESSGGVYQQSEAWDGQWECVISRADA